MSIEHILRHSDLWQARASRTHTASPDETELATGFAGLDDALGLGGWPLGATTELLSDHSGIGELRLLLPALAHLSQNPKWLTLVAPPHIPYAPALAAAGIDISRILLIHPRKHQDKAWVTEQALKSGCCSAVLSWEERDNSTTDKDRRRLQLAAKQHHCWHIQFRPFAAQQQPSPAALRLALQPDSRGLHIHIIKQRRGWSGQQVHIPLPDTLQNRTLPSHQLPLPRVQTAPPDCGRRTARPTTASTGRHKLVVMN